ncbi:LPXTG cell wall anchor domain-containing protein [Streptomyces sp. NPDC088745]|uniref:LPXTG cell wall anchor domain-containing protein n=1 Tax=Streptomyces sp. NPDC088745 TaxID=3365884 RepID=UPI003803C676
MKIRRMLATAVVAAVTTPALLLSVAPAFAADAPPAAGQAQDAKPKPTPAELEKLKKVMDEAKTAYDTAAAKAAAAQKYADEYLNPDSPARKPIAEAKKAAEVAGAALTAAKAELTKAEEALANLPKDAPEAEVTKAKEAVKAADDKHKLAVTAKSDADRTLSFTEGNLFKGYMDAKTKAAEAAIAAESAKKVYDDAAKAYKDAEAAAGKPDPTKPPVDPTKPPVDPTKPPVDPTKPPVDPTKPPVDDECKVGPELRTTLVGLPGKVVAGTTVNFTLRVTNGTGKKVDEIKPFAVVYGHDNKNFDDISKLLRLQAAGAGSDDWKDVKEAEYAGTVTNLDAGKSADLKLRLTVDKKAPAADGIAFAAGDYANEDGSCGGNDLTEYTFSILTAGSDPGKVPDAKPGKVANPANVPVPQGGASATPVTTDAGNLAATGSAGTPQVALAAGAAVVLGAGAMFVVRRRKAGQEA